jgi:para-nitrobenzyl esterase
MTRSLLFGSFQLLACIAFVATVETSHASPKETHVTPGDSTVVMTDKGAVRGLVNDGVREFKGIPYAAPPVGNLRWQLAHEKRPWKGILDATRFSSPCPQITRYGLTEASYDEDCLTLNVTVPTATLTAAASTKLPVFVWIHGGAFGGGIERLISPRSYRQGRERDCCIHELPSWSLWFYGPPRI